MFRKNDKLEEARYERDVLRDKLEKAGWDEEYQDRMVEHLENDRDYYRDKCASQAKHLHKLQNQNRDLKAKPKLSEINDKIGKLERGNVRLQEHLASAQAGFSESDAENDALRLRVSKFAQKLDGTRDYVKRLEEKLRVSQAEVHKYENTMDNENLKYEIGRLKMDQADRIQEHRNLREYSQELYREIDGLEDKNDELRSKLAAARQNNRGLQDKLCAAQTDNNYGKFGIDWLRASRSRVIDTVNELREKQGHYKRLVAALEKELNDYAIEKPFSPAARAELVHKIRELSLENQQLQHHMRSMWRIGL